MALTNNIKKQVDLPVWEWCRLAPTASAAVSSTCTADNSLYHVSFGRYIYFMNTNPAAVAAATGYITGFMRYDTFTDTYQILNFPLAALATYSAMQFAGGQGYNARVISAGTNTITAALLTGKTLKGFDIRIIGGTGAGQLRIVTDVSNATISYTGTVTAAPVTPQNYVTDANANWTINQWAGYQIRFMHVSGQSQTRKIIYNTPTTLYFSDVTKMAEDQWVWTPVYSMTGSAYVVAVAGTPYQIESSTLTVDSPWQIQPDETSRFVVRSGGIWMVTSGATYALQYYDIAADQWYVRNAGAATSPVTAVGSEATIVNSGENATVFERGTATGTHSKKNLQDTTKTWTPNQWIGYSLRIFSGTGEGRVINILSNTNNNLIFDPVACVDAQVFASASGVSGAYIVTTTTITPVNCNGFSISGTGIGTNAKIVSGQGTTTLVLSVANTTTVTGDLTMGTSATGNSGEYTITTSIPTPQTCNGWDITGVGIGTNATIVSGQGTTNLVLSVANSGTVSGIIAMDLSLMAASGVAGSYNVTVTTLAPVNCNGWQVIGTGISPGATIVSGQGTTSLTLSLPNTGTVSGFLDLDMVPDATSKYAIDAFEVGIVTSVNPPSPIAAITITAIAGVISSPNITLNSNVPANCLGWYVFGPGITPGTTILSGQGTKNIVLSANNSSAVSGMLIISPSYVSATAAATCTINTYGITTSASTPANCNGWYIYGVGVGIGATIVSGQNTTSLTVSMINTATFSSGTLYLCPTIATPTVSSLSYTGSGGAYVITTSPNTILTPNNCLGWYATGSGIGIGAVVVLGGGGPGTNNITLSVANSGSVSGIVTLSPTIASATAATGVMGTYTITTNVGEANTPANCNGWYISGTGIALGATIISGQGTKTLTLSIANTATVSAGTVLTLSATAVSTGSISGSVFTAGATTGAYYPGQILIGSGVQTPSTIVSPVGACFTTTAVTTVNFSVGNPQAMGIVPGMQVTFLGGTTGSFSAGTHVAYTANSVTSSTVVLSAVPSATLGYATIQFGPAIISDTGATSNGPLVTLATGTTNPLSVGMFVSVVSGTGTFALGTYITQINSTTTFTVSQTPTAQLTGGANFVLFQPYQTMITGQLSGISGGAGTYSIYPSQGTQSLSTLMTATGTSGQFTITTTPASPANCNGLSITGFGITYGATVVSGQGTTTLTLSIANSATVSGVITLSPLSATSTIIGVGNSVLVDNTKNWPLNRWNNQVVRIKSGTASGDYRSILATTPGYVTYTSNAGVVSSNGNLVTLGSGTTSGLSVGMVVNVTTAANTGVFVYGTTVTAINNSTSFTISTIPVTPLSSATITGAPVNTLVTYSTWNTIPDSSSRYVIHGDTDKNYLSLGGQTPTFVHNIEADILTLGRMLDYGVARGVSAQFSDHNPVALLVATPSVPVMPIVSAVGYVAPVLGSALPATPSVTGGITTVCHLGGIYPIGSWITVAGITPTTYNGTWQVCNSSFGSVSYWNASGTYASGIGTATITQANSIVIGGTLASGAYAALGNGTQMTIFGCVPAAYNGLVTVTAGSAAGSGYTFGGYQATGVSGTSATVFNVSSTAGLVIGAIPTVTAGTGSFPSGTVITSFVANTSFTVNNATTLSGATVNVVPSVAWVGTVPGNLITTGVVQKTPQAVLSGTSSGTTCTLLPTAVNPTIYPVGSWITVTGITPAGYNGVYQVSASLTTGSVSYVIPASLGNASTTVVAGATVGLATMMQLVNTVNTHSFKTGQYVTHRGDNGFSSVNNNITAPISTVLMFTAGAPIQSTQYTYPVGAPSGPMVSFTQTTSILYDAAKNWLPNQWAGCMVTFNSTQISNATVPVQPTSVSAHVVSNTSNILIFAAAHTLPAVGVSRYVITSQASSPVQNVLGSSDSGMALGVQSGTVVQDVSKSWVSPGGSVGVMATGIAATTAVTIPIVNTANLYVGMQGILLSTSAPTLTYGTTIATINAFTGALTMSAAFAGSGTAVMLFGYGVTSAVSNGATNTITILGTVSGLYVGMVATVSYGSVTLPVGTTITAISGIVVTLSNFIGGTTSAATFSFTAPCSSSGNVVTVGGGWTTAGLQPGMYVGVLSAGNYSAALPTTGAFIASGGTNLTPVKVTSVLSPTQFTVSSTPAIALFNATVIASFWLPNMWINRRIKITSGTGANYLEATCTTNNYNAITTGGIATPVHGSTGYSILQQPIRSVGTALFWNYGASDLNTRGCYLWQARGGAAAAGLSGWDRLDVRTDKWEFLMPTPNFEGLTVGAMYAYDGGDRIYFTTSGTNRVYYLDLENLTIHGASQYPYLAGGVLPGNRMEIFETVDGLKYLWLNRNTGMESFKQLLFY
jgi:hypothetical protein